MNTKSLLLFLIIFTLNSSCDNNTSTNIKIGNAESSKMVSKSSYTITNNKLKYKTGIRSILEDSKGNYWFGSHQEGVCLYDGKSFQYFTMEDGLNDNQVRTIEEDKNGNIWFGTARGVNSYDGKKIISHAANEIIMTGILNGWQKTDDDLWFNAGNKPGVFRYDGQQLQYLPFPVSQVDQPFNHYGVTGFSKSKNGKIWISTYAAVFGYDGYTIEIIDDKKLDFEKETNQLHVRSILEDSKGNLWIGNNGIGVLLNDGKTTINFSKKNPVVASGSTKEGLTSFVKTLDHVFAIEEDSKGNIWFGDRDTGTWKYDGKTMTNYNKDDGLTNVFVQTIYKDKKDKLWFGLGNGDVFQFDGKSFIKMF